MTSLAHDPGDRSRRLDAKLTEQVNAIMHHEDFQQMECAWRGLQHLVNNTETDETLKIRVFNISKKELGKTLKKFKGTAWDQSPIFKKIYEEEYGQFGGEPFGVTGRRLLLRPLPAGRRAAGRHGAGRRRGARAVHRRRRAVADADGDRWQELANPRDLTKIFQTPEYAAWRRLRESRGCALSSAWRCRASWRACRTAPRRTRSRSSPSRRTPKAPTRQVLLGELRLRDGHEHQPLVQALRLVLAASAASSRGGAVEGLPTHTFPTDDGGVDMKCPTEIAISDRREAELAKNGFMPLIHKKNTDFAAFIGAQSLQKPADTTTRTRRPTPTWPRACRICSRAAASRTT